MIAWYKVRGSESTQWGVDPEDNSRVYIKYNLSHPGYDLVFLRGDLKDMLAKLGDE